MVAVIFKKVIRPSHSMLGSSGGFGSNADKAREDLHRNGKALLQKRVSTISGLTASSFQVVSWGSSVISSSPLLRQILYSDRWSNMYYPISKRKIIKSRLRSI